MIIDVEIGKTRLIQTEIGYKVAVDLSPEDMRRIYDAQACEYAKEDIKEQICRMVDNHDISPNRAELFLLDNDAMYDTAVAICEGCGGDSYWWRVEQEIMRRID